MPKVVGKEPHFRSNSHVWVLEGFALDLVLTSLTGLQASRNTCEFRVCQSSVVKPEAATRRKMGSSEQAGCKIPAFSFMGFSLAGNIFLIFSDGAL